MDNVLQLQKISKSFGSISVLKDLNFSIQAGDFVTVLGPSGSGKSTFLHIAGLMEKPNSGSIMLLDEDISQLGAKPLSLKRLSAVGFIFQFHYLLPDFDVLENVLIPCRLANDNIQKATSEAKSLLERLGLSERLTHRPQQLSGGEQQRAALARALIKKPPLLLCDEPTGNLDANTGQQVWDLLKKEAAAFNVATVIVTHNQSLARNSSMSYYLSDGQLNSAAVEAPS